MDATFRLLLWAAALHISSGCASHHDSRLIKQRTSQLYPQEHRTPGASPEPLPTLAPEGLLELASLEDYLAFGTQNSAELRAAFETWRASTERVFQVSSLPDPRLSYGEFLEEIQTRTGPQERRFGLSQSLPWPGELDTKSELASRQAEANWERVEEVRLAVARKIEHAFHDYAFLAQELAITEELLKLVKGLEPVVQGRVRAGAGQADLLKLQIEIGRLEDALVSIQERRPAASATLASTMNLPPELATALPLPPLVELDPRESTIEVSEHSLLDSNPKLRRLEQQLRTAESAMELSKFESRPSLGLRLDYIQTGDALNPQTPGSGDDPVLLGLSMSLPVWSSSNLAAEREAQHQVRAARARLEGARVTLNADLSNQLFRVEDAKRRVRLYKESLIPRAHEALRLTTAAYRAGSASVLDLLDSERALLEFELSLWRASREYLQGDARLREILGGRIR